MPRAKLGDILEVPTASGLAYAQYTHQHPMYGGLIRVFEPLFAVRPSSFAELALGPLRFSTFLPVRATVHRKIFQVVSRQEIAPPNQSFPLFRSGIANPRTKKVAVWWFWDGEKSWKVGEITLEQRKMPICEVWNDTMLILRIEQGWTPENDLE